MKLNHPSAMRLECTMPPDQSFIVHLEYAPLPYYLPTVRLEHALHVTSNFSPAAHIKRPQRSTSVVRSTRLQLRTRAARSRPPPLLAQRARNPQSTRIVPMLRTKSLQTVHEFYRMKLSYVKDSLLCSIFFQTYLLFTHRLNCYCSWLEKMK